MQISKEALVAAVSQPKLVYKMGESQDELWICDVKIARGADVVLFEQIIFVESAGLAYVYGLEYEAGYPVALSPPERAQGQQDFILFMRAQSRQDRDAVSRVTVVTPGHEFWTEAKVTAAYIAARGQPLALGIGYDAGEDEGYQLITIDPESSGWAEAARLMPSFDALEVSPQAGRS